MTNTTRLVNELYPLGWLMHSNSFQFHFILLGQTKSSWSKHKKERPRNSIRSIRSPEKFQTTSKTEIREMVSMSGDRQRSASTSVVQEVSTSKDSPSASTSTVAGTSNCSKDKKMSGTSSGPTMGHVLPNSLATVCGSNGMAPAPSAVNSLTRRATANAANPSEQGQLHNEESPNHIVYRKVRHVYHSLHLICSGIISFALIRHENQEYYRWRTEFRDFPCSSRLN